MICVVCSLDFEPKGKYLHAKFCSSKCRANDFKIKTGRISAYDNLSTGTVGAISELIASTHLLTQGWAVFRALSQSCFCDLVAFKSGEKPRFIEVKTGYKNPVSGALIFAKNKHREGVTHYLVVESNKEKTVHLILYDEAYQIKASVKEPNL